MSWLIALVLKPFVLLIALCSLAAVRISLAKWMPDSRLKRLLLLRLNEKR